ncbi:MAG: hypothetical protein EOP42_17035 [Sphingobacteriaceae bacterium]|nr:MAG: hypothetical protein EOP42_17035 [Sphingobacteriaceae bacterium]
MAESNKTSIAPSLLPKGWRTTIAQEFNISEATVYAYAAGLRKNEVVFQRLLALAEEKRISDLHIDKRLTALYK